MEAGMVTPAPALVRFSGIQKTYDGEHLVVKNLDLDIAKGEFVTLLGPSGSGKTTTLMMLAGFEVPTRGEIYLADRPVKNTPPHKRDIGMVFQNYALFPHLTIEENVAFPLSVRKINKAEVQARVRNALRMIKLENLGQRRPAQLSGGQQQRVALARALVFNPQLVLMDEPLGALDKRLREQMQLEIKQLHETMGITVVYVTHDQSEALTMSDRIAVFNDGIVQQIDRPERAVRAPGEQLCRQLHRREQRAVRHRRERSRRTIAASALADGGARGRTGGQRIRRGRADLPVGAAGADRHHDRTGPPARDRTGCRRRCRTPSISATTHWPCSMSPATRSSWSSFSRARMKA
jgi:putative spermidine/putrescine transport system ATP-binding protein